jgi:hypothetical protein
MNVVFNAVDEDWVAADALEHASHVSVHSRTLVSIVEKWDSALRAEDDMEDNASERLWHG